MSDSCSSVSEQAAQPDSEPPYLRRRWQLRYRHRVLIQRSILPFTWPILIELVCVVLMGIVSTILVSRIGKDATAAVGITDSVTYIILSLLTAIALGGSVLIAQAFGRRDRPKALFGASQVMNLGVLVSLLCCAAMFLFSESVLTVVAYGAEPEVIDLAAQYLKIIALSYPALAITLSGSGILRAVGNSRSPATTNILMNIFNIAISYPLIYGIDAVQWQGLGMIGAGIGITAARWIGAGMILFVLTHNGSLRVPANAFLKPFNRLILREILVIGVPASVESLMFNIGKLITQIMVAGMGTIVMAGNVITFSVLLFVNIPGNALAMAATVLIGKRLGQGQTRVARLEMHLILLLATGALTVLGIAFVPFAHNIGAIYSDDAAVIDVVVNLIYLNALMMPIWAASFVLPAAFKGAKDVKYSMWTAIMSMWGCRIVLGYLLGIHFGFGIYGIWLGMFADWWLRGALYLYRMISQRWLTAYLTAEKKRMN
ncbi:EmmdR/YeeO family multidrug/toxin efflux MATE transporter [Vibrio furnissii]|uniref:EmmdR/YeeO family multidrug/toxin efflux MATE transporter n=1 Tax=Vibrio TaxID=662 RepID=UPI0011D0737D|nr:EmmdR/YeeO family multidrug/toxin efflux MATE transporter [Vibrio furnissii]MCG6229049.1 EmmdR/YeeO family multidrug/toxin efflux MATE transporter [Vibrio furnissii]